MKYQTLSVTVPRAVGNIRLALGGSQEKYEISNSVYDGYKNSIDSAKATITDIGYCVY
jgi:hypothetical protein